MHSGRPNSPPLRAAEPFASFAPFTRLAFPALLAAFTTLPLAKSIGAGIFDRLALVDLATGVAALATVAALLAGPALQRNTIGATRLPRALAAGLLLLLAFAALSLPNAESSAASFVELGAYVVNFILFLVVVAQVRTRERLLQCLAFWEAGAAIAVAGGLVGVAFVLAGRFDSPFTDGPLLTSTFPKSGQFASFLLASFPILVFQRFHRSSTARARFARTALLVAAALALVATASRSGLAIAVALGAATAFVAARRQPRRAVAFAGAGVAALALLLATADVLPFAARRALSIVTPSSLALDRISPARAAQWSGWQAAVDDRSPFGLGPAGYFPASTSLAPAAFRPHELHNTFLGVWAEAGIGGAFGLALFLGALVRVGVTAVRDAPDPELRAASLALAVAVLGIGCYGLFHFGLRMRALWAAQGLLLAVWNLNRAAASSVLRPRPASATGAA